MVDETTDITNEQVTVVTRRIDEDLVVHEELFLGVPCINAATLMSLKIRCLG